MADGDKEFIGGWLVVEDSRFGWDQGIGDTTLKVVVCGEIGHVRWLLFQVAWRESCRRDTQKLLREFAERVGTEYGPTQRRLSAPHDDETDDTGGKP